jgi:hypothetical protein
MGERFPLAPMSRPIRIVTGVLLAIPPAFAALALALGAPLALPAALVAGLYAAVWLGARPAAFELDAGALHVRFPLWTRSLPARSLASARVVEGAALRGELGFALRVGVGGLWGGFGWLWSAKRGWLELYVSRTDRLVWIERRAGLPLLITPERPSELVERLRSPPA